MLGLLEIWSTVLCAVLQDRHVGVADTWLCCVGTLCMDRILELINTGN